VTAEQAGEGNMRRILVVVGVVLALSAGAIPGVAWAQIGPDGTPQVEGGTETMRYAEAVTPQLLTHYWIVMSEVDSFPQSPSPQDVKQTELRKRILDLRLVMDFGAYVYEPGLFEAYRDATDAAYEQVGQYKDLFDVQELDGAPIDPIDQAERLAKMNVAVSPFRLPSFREDLKTFFYARLSEPLSLERKNQPRIWQIAGVGPTDGLDSVGNAAMLGQSVLRNLQNEGLLVADIFDPQQEARFHDVRKALRSALVLTDMFPTLAATTADTREPLARVVRAYGKVNDQFVAYHDAQLAGRDLEPRAAALRDEYGKTQVTVSEAADSGQIEAFAVRLESVQAAHRR
jgi:hypothetical protein